MPDIPQLALHDGNSIPQLGFGIWQVASDVAADVVKTALQTGYRLIDGAYLYMNEEGLGEGLRRSGVPREEVFITTKVWNNEQGRAKARASVERSLKTIGVDQLDLVLIHWPVPSQDLYVETWKAFIEMRDEGLMRSIGVSNFNADHLERIIGETGEVPVLNQIELNPELQQPEMRAANARHGIVTQAWTPLAMAGRSNRRRSRPPSPAPARARRRSRSAGTCRWATGSSPARSRSSVRQRISMSSISP